MVQPQLTAAVAAETHLAALVGAVRSGEREASLRMPPALYPFASVALESPAGIMIVESRNIAERARAAPIGAP